MLEMTWSRPTCEINGMGGGYQGAGFKTVIPAKAIGEDLVPPGVRPGPARDPQGLPRARARQRIPADCKVEFHEHGAGPRHRLPDRRARPSPRRAGALTDEWGREAAFIGGGGSIPVTTS